MWCLKGYRDGPEARSGKLFLLCHSKSGGFTFVERTRHRASSRIEKRVFFGIDCVASGRTKLSSRVQRSHKLGTLGIKESPEPRPKKSKKYLERI